MASNAAVLLVETWRTRRSECVLSAYEQCTATEAACKTNN